jgi:hypothetical protein
MVPECRQSGSVRLYRADTFPDSWSFVGELVQGGFVDPTFLAHDERCWLFAQRGLDELRLFTALEPTGPWIEHDGGALVVGNRRITRPGGRPLQWGHRLLRFAQDGLPTYGNQLRVLEVDRLTPTEYAERELPESPLLKASRKGWNAMGMHHVDALPVDGEWIAAVDGAAFAIY